MLFLLKINMKNTIKYTIIAIISLSTFNCSNYSNFNSQNIDVIQISEDVVKVQEIYLQSIDFDDPPFCPKSCCVERGNLVVLEDANKVSNDYFRIYSGTKLIKKFGGNGNGPEDFISPFLNSDGKTEFSGFYVIDGGVLKHIVVDDDNISIKLYSDLPKEFFLANKVLQYNDSIIAAYVTSDFQIQYYDKSNGNIIGRNYFDKSDRYKQVADWNCLMTLFRAAFSYTEKYAIIAYQNFKCIDLVSLEDRSVKRRLCFPNYDNNSFVVDNDIALFDENLTFYFSCISSNEENFYVMSWDSSYKKVNNGEVNGTIYKFDYEGNLISIYKTNQGIQSFVVADNMIYAIGLDHNSKEWTVYKGEIK